MQQAKLQKFTRKSLGLLGLILLSCAWTSSTRIEYLSMDMEAKSLFQGKYVTTTATLYYQADGAELVTYIRSPIQQIVYTSALGEFKSYNIEQNSVVIMEGSDFSSKSSFIYQFLNGETNDMGLRALKYKMTDTKVEDGLLVNTWMADVDLGYESPKIEVVYEDFMPIYMGFYGADGSIKQKTYYSDYHEVSYTKLPFTITEVMFLSEADSSITRRSYSNLKTNSQVDRDWLEFNIPSDAKVISTEDVQSIFQQQ